MIWLRSPGWHSRQALIDRTELTTAQRTFLGALVANAYQPFGEALCLLALGT